MHALTIIGFAMCALANLGILISISKRISDQRALNALHIEEQQAILDKMTRLHHEEKWMHDRQMKSNAAVMDRWAEVLDAYRRILFWQNR